MSISAKVDVALKIFDAVKNALTVANVPEDVANKYRPLRRGNVQVHRVSSAASVCLGGSEIYVRNGQRSARIRRRDGVCGACHGVESRLFSGAVRGKWEGLCGRSNLRVRRLLCRHGDEPWH